MKIHRHKKKSTRCVFCSSGMERKIRRRAGLWGREGGEQPRGGRGGRGRWRTKKRREGRMKAKKGRRGVGGSKRLKKSFKGVLFFNQIP